MTRPLGKALIGCSHGSLPERVTLREANKLEARQQHRMAVWWAKLLHGASDTDLSEAPAKFFDFPQHGPERL